MRLCMMDILFHDVGINQVEVEPVVQAVLRLAELECDIQQYSVQLRTVTVPPARAPCDSYYVT